MNARPPDSRIDPIEDSVDGLAELLYDHTMLSPTQCQRVARKILVMADDEYA